MLNNASILVTGGTGSFGQSFVDLTLHKYNPRRLVIFSKTNINGAMNLIDAAIDQGVKKVVALSTDKAVLLTYMAQLN